MYKRVRQYLFSVRIKKPDRVEDGDAQGLQGVLFDLHEHLSAALIERVYYEASNNYFKYRLVASGLQRAKHV